MAKAKEIIGLECGVDAASGIRMVLRARLDEMCALRAAALEWSDPEGVHDMRVASRRLRSAMRDFAPFLRKRRFAQTRDHLKEIADALGGVRDLDVNIIALEKLLTKSPVEVSKGIEQLIERRRADLEHARAALQESVTQEALAGLQEKLKVALKHGIKTKAGKKISKDKKGAKDISFREAGRSIIISRIEELEDLSLNLYRPFATQPLHRMRITAKRLRYALQLFGPCWDSLDASFEREIAALQNSLGELHDCDVWIESLGRELAAANDVSSTGEIIEVRAEQRCAAHWLLGYFVKSRTRQFLDALARYQKWEETEFASHLVAALATAPARIILRPIAMTATEAVAADLEAQVSP